MTLFYLSSGLFLGWSLGANDAANVFGTAVGTKMVRFKTAAVICGIFVILGAVLGGSGTTETLGDLGAVDAMAGAFMVATAAAVTVFWMSRVKIPVSTSQTIVGAIVGWNFFSGSVTNYDALTKIVATWVVCPVLAALIAMLFFMVFRAFFNRVRIHLLRLDLITRAGLVIVGAFGAYSLGANNIANVMGVFVTVWGSDSYSVLGLFPLSSTQLLFLLGGIAIGVGVFTYSHKVMQTVGSGIFKLSPQAALVIVLTHGIVLFLFASEGLENWLIRHGLPTIPLVPVSSTQAVIGAVVGIGIYKGMKSINFAVLGEVAIGWVTSPVIAGVITFVGLFFMQNVFNQQVSQPKVYEFSDPVLEYLMKKGLPAEPLQALRGRTFEQAMKLRATVRGKAGFDDEAVRLVAYAAERVPIRVDSVVVATKLQEGRFKPEQVRAIRALTGGTYDYRWQFIEALRQQTEAWRFREDTRANKLYNKKLRAKLDYLVELFRVPAEDTG